jgi:hypothetical protein
LDAAFFVFKAGGNRKDKKTMTGNSTEGEQTPEGAGTPSPVSTEPAKSFECGNAELSRLLDAKLNDALKPVLSEVRGLQSRQDKSDKVNREFMDEYRKNLKSGMSEIEAETQAQTTIDNRSAEKRRQDWIDQQIANSSPAGNGTGDAARRIAQKLNIDPNTAEFTALAAKYTDPVDLAVEAGKLAGSRNSAQNTAGVGALPTGSPPPADKSEAALTQDYQKEMLAAKRGDKTALTQIKEKYRKLGVPVDTVAFV